MKQNFKILLLTFIFLPLTSAFADVMDVAKDSVSLEELVVTGTRTKSDIRQLAMSLSVINSTQIEARKDVSLLPLLTEEVPGLFITQRGTAGYGVSGGSAGAMSMRGVGGSPTSGLLILIDGQPQYMGLMGHPLADSYQSHIAERVEVVRGPASVLYGTNAMGGVINIITKKSETDGFNTGLRLMGGSFATLSGDAHVDWKKDRLSLHSNLSYYRSNGHRENMEFEQFSGLFKATYRFTDHWNASSSLNISQTASSNPGTIVKPLLDNDADVTRGVANLALSNSYAKSSGSANFYYNFGSHHINDGYAVGGTPLISRFRSTDALAGISLNQSFHFFKGNTLTAGADWQQFGGKAWNTFTNGTPNADLADVTLYDVAGYLNMQQFLLDNKLALSAGLRYDYHETHGGEWVPQLGVTYSPIETNSMKLSVGKGFRNPTIREMYMFPPQNPDLKPEKLLNYEVAVMQSFLDKRLQLEANVFYIVGENMIQTQMVDGRPLNVNVGEINNKGFELSGAYRISQAWNVSGNYSFLHMEHNLLGAPKHKLNLRGNYRYKTWDFSTGLQYIQGLYTVLAPETVESDFLLWNLRVNYHLSKNLEVFARGENLLNQSYEINAGFPMPGVTAFAGLQFKL